MAAEAAPLATAPTLGGKKGSVASIGDFSATFKSDVTMLGGGDPLAATDGFEASGRRPRKRNPGARWDGRVEGLSLKEYREMKWGIDAAFGKVNRGGPSFTCRPKPPIKSPSTNDTMLTLDVFSAFNASKRVGPSYSVGMLPMPGVCERSKGPAEYKIKSTMDPRSHPTIPKHTGAKMGSETLLVKDEERPAPGQYDHEAFKRSGTIPQAPRWTTQGREAFVDRAEAPDPGPGEYPVEHGSRLGKHTPITWTMQGKTEPLAQPRGSRLYPNPGPPHYNPPGAGAKNDHCATHRPPKWRLGSEPRGLL